MRVASALSLLLVGACTNGSPTGGGGGSAGNGGAGPTLACPPGQRELDDGSCLPAGTQADGCAAGELGDNGTCEPAGLRPEDCGEGFAHDGDRGCEPILPATPCGPGTWAIPGDVACRDFMACGAGPWPEVTGASTVVYVDAAASSAPDGSPAAPFASLAEAVAAAPEGATIAIAAGSYDGPVQVANKTLSVVGRCASMVSVVATGDVALSFGPGADGSAASGLAVTGDGRGVTVTDASGVTLTALWLHDLTEEGLVAERIAAATSVTVERSLVELVTGRGVYAIGATLSLDAVAIRDIAENASKMGRAVDTDLPATKEPNAITVHRSHIARSSEVALLIHASSAEVTSSLVVDTLPRSDDRFGRAVMVQTDDGQHPATLAVRRSVIDGAYDAGVLAAGAELELDRVVVRNIEINQDEGWRGYGVGALGQTVAPTRVVARRVSVERAHEVGIVNLGASMELEAVHVRDTEAVYGLDDPDFPTGFAGRGISTQRDHVLGLAASTTIRGSVVERNAEIGIAVMGATMDVAGTLVRDTVPVNGLFGRAIVIQHSPIDDTRSTALVVDSHLVDNHEIGLSVTASQAELEGVLVEGTRAGGPGNAFATAIVVEIDEPTLMGATAEVRHCALRDHGTVSVLAIGSDLLFDHGLIETTNGQPETGLFGDGLLAMTSVDVPNVVVRDSRIADTSRAGVASFGGVIELGGTTIDCAVINIAVSELEGADPTLTDLGGNRCLCGPTEIVCKALSTNLEPPDPPESL